MSEAEVAAVSALSAVRSLAEIVALALYFEDRGRVAPRAGDSSVCAEAVGHNGHASAGHLRAFGEVQARHGHLIVFEFVLVLRVEAVGLLAVVDARVSESRLAVASTEDVDAIFSLALQMVHQVSDLVVLCILGGDVDPIVIQSGLVEASILFSSAPHDLSARKMVEAGFGVPTGPAVTANVLST